ncbi:MAG TPA: deoxyribose-phosphate aldolase, partial [Candidatus Acidoferrum sp.]|nr:deoxyribose-phosphate aldolase [Candidatus Acidoferrum sp.]
NAITLAGLGPEGYPQMAQNGSFDLLNPRHLKMFLLQERVCAFDINTVTRYNAAMMQPLTPKQLAQYIDHTLLKPDATAADIDQLCREAIEHGFWSVCVNGSRVAQAYALVENTNVKVACTVGFPLGAMSADVKRYEVEAAIDDGAQEIDVVLNIGKLKDGDDAYVLRELRDVAEAADERTVKVIFETCLLSRDEKIRACKLVVESGAHFVKTSTGFSTSGATTHDVQLMRQLVGGDFGVKASGGIKEAKIALAMIEAGATRLGTSSGVAIVKGVAGTSAY